MIYGKNNIVWLASYPKSGNTWFRILLTNFLSESQDPTNINELDKTFLASNRALFDQYVGTNSSDLLNDEIQILRPSLYRRISSESDKNVYMKVHDAWEKNINLEPLFPKDVTKGVIYIIRHPLDVAVSLAYHNGASFQQSLIELNDQKYGFCIKKNKLHNQLTQNLLTWAKHVTSWIDNSHLPIHIIRYEDMLKNTFHVFTEALEFLNLEYEVSKVKKSIKDSSFNVVRDQEQLFGFREKPMNLEKFFRTGSCGNWKQHYNYEQIEPFLSDNVKLMERFDYYLK